MSDKNPYPKHSLYDHVVPFDLVFGKNETVGKTLKLIQQEKESWPNSENLYVVDDERKLIGVIDFKLLLASSPNIKLSEIMNKKFDILTSHSHQSTAIDIAVKRGVVSIPIVDKELHFLGIIDAGAIFKIMHEEHVEKLMNFSGILNHESLIEGYKTRIKDVAKSRLPWLIFGLVGGGVSTFIVQVYAKTLQTEIALAFFIPVIVYMNDAVGTQAQTVFVRNSTIEKVKLVKSLIFETKVTLLIGATLSTIMYAFAAIWLGSKLALVVSLSMFLGILSSALIGTVIPWCLEKLGKDPAIGSGPFTTIIQDLLSIVIYFGIANLII